MQRSIFRHTLFEEKKIPLFPFLAATEPNQPPTARAQHMVPRLPPPALLLRSADVVKKKRETFILMVHPFLIPFAPVCSTRRDEQN
jgi:hypothetical protein